MQNAPKGLRLHVGIFGRRNSGKSSLLNALTRQSVSIVSEVAGTTTDPVEKPMEVLPLGPVLFIDTAGVDDTGGLGLLRIEKTRQVFARTDLALILSSAGEWTEFEEELLQEFLRRKVAVLVVFNKSDLGRPEAALLQRLKDLSVNTVETVASRGEGITELRDQLIRTAPEEFINAPGIVGDLIPAGSLVILVVPIDMEAPKGRLILPQVQTIREILDVESYCMVVKERELRNAIDRLKVPPALVITDSQGFLKVAADTPREIPLTSFSILFARAKGELTEFVRGAMAIENLVAGDRILVAEACSHHPVGEDIGRVKIPRWLTQYVGGRLDFTFIQGHDFPEDLSSYKLVVHCGSCMWNRREMLSRQLLCRSVGVPMANYGLTIAYSLGVFDRALEIFPDALEVYRQNR